MKRPRVSGASCTGGRGGSALRFYAHVHALLDALAPVAHYSAGKRKQRVIGADADVVPGTVHGAALAHEDIAGQHLLAAEPLEPEALAVGSAAVLGAAARFLVGHGDSCRSGRSGALDAGDPDFGVGLSVRALAQIVLAA